MRGEIYIIAILCVAFNVAFTENACDELFANNKKLGIESLAEMFYAYIIANTPKRGIMKREEAYE